MCDPETLLNLVIRRCLRNEAIRDYYGVNAEDVLRDVERQRELFYRIFPDQVEAGSRKPTTLDWMLGRVRDGTGRVAPRELIHLLAALRDTELRLIEIGAAEPPGEQLFDRSAFKTALSEVSRARLEQTLLAEYPALRDFVMKLERRKTLQTATTLAEIWGRGEEQALEVAGQLVEVGFFERRQTPAGYTYWIPFLYRDALQLVQGTEGSAEGGDSSETEEDEELGMNEPLPGM